MKKLFVCMYSHRHGYDHYMAYSDRDLTREDFIKYFDIDFEEDLEDENLEVWEEKEEIPTIS